MAPMKQRSSSLALWGATVVAALILFLVLFVPSPPTGDPNPPAPAVARAGGDHDVAVAAVSTHRGRQDDFRRQVERALRISDPARRRAVLTGVLASWLQSDPAGFEKYLMALEVDGADGKLAMLADALDGALAALDPKVVASAEVREPLRRFIVHMASADPATAAAWADAWLDDDTRESALVRIAGALAARDPDAALAMAAALKSQFRRMQAYAVVGGVWARTDAAAATAWASALPAPTDRAMALNAVLMNVAQNDAPSAAADLATAEHAMGTEYQMQYARDLASMNVTEADLANDPQKFEEMMSAGAIPPPTSSDVELLADAARVIAGRLGAENGAASVAWAEALENEFVRLSAVKGAVTGWSETDPAAAASWVASHYGRYTEMVTAVYETWAGSAPSSAAAATQWLDDAELRASAIETVATTWAAEDPAAAARWADRLPLAEQTDAVRLAIVTGLSTANPVDAWNRAQAIQDPSMQYRALKVAFSELVIRTPGRARELLASSNLTGRTAERLQALLASG
jgi:hypothetical protein